MNDDQVFLVEWTTTQVTEIHARDFQQAERFLLDHQPTATIVRTHLKTPRRTPA